MNNKKLLFILLCLLGTVKGFAQGGERLTTIDYNLELLLKSDSEQVYNSRSGEFTYFQVDTINLPFVDDFSSIRFTSYHLPQFAPSDITPKIAVNFTVDGNVVDTVRYMRDTSYTYTYTQSTNTIDSTPNLNSFIIRRYEAGQFPKNPYVPFETFQAWPTYYRIVNKNGNIDTIPVIPSGTLILDTISHFIANIASQNSLWLDYDVYINNSFPVNPPTIGVVTFDGLKSNGQAYAPGLQGVPNQRGIADHLTSKPINLKFNPQDSVHFSFYYQPQGMGNAPEGVDSLVVEFYSPVDSLWKHQWSLGGRAVQDFKQVIIPITDTMFLQNGFQFRFKNYADLSGNLDHWNVDYVRLFQGRDRAKPYPEDVAFQKPASILLKNYRQMPWKQFVANAANEMDRNLLVSLRNLSQEPKVLEYTFNIKNQSGTVLATRTSTGSEAALSSFSYSNNIGINFPASTSKYEQFTVENYIYTPVDSLRVNDTIRHLQKFDNFYAYDDGIPEAGYGLNLNGAKLATRFVANVADDLTAVRIHFTPINIQSKIYPFKLTIWSSLNPETILYQDEVFSYPAQSEHLLGFAEYVLPEPVKVSGDFYVGMVQVSNVELNVGFDKSFNSKENIFFNLNGNWNNTLFNGSLMIRPVFGPSNDPTLGIVEQPEFKTEQKQLKIYPNPATNHIYIEGITQSKGTSITIFDLYGRKVIYHPQIDLPNIDVTGLSEGMYVLKVENINTGFSHSSKIMVSR